MLSKILSSLFRIGFFLGLLGGILELIVQVRQKPIVLKNTEDSYRSIGAPGIAVKAMRSNNMERLAPDTIISFQVKEAPLFIGGSSGQIRNRGSYGKEWFDSMATKWRKHGDSIIIDTEINLMLSRNTSWFERGPSAFEDLPDGKVVFKWRQKKGDDKNNPVLSDTFPNMATAMAFHMVGDFGRKQHIREEGLIYETLRIKPVNTTQHILFVLYILLLTACGLLLLLTLARLFSNFHRHEYFTVHNVTLLRNTGLYLLFPQLLHFIFYWAFLAGNYPVKFRITGSDYNDVKEVASYSFESGMEWTYIFLGLGILILSYIFKNGLALQEDFDLNV